MRVPRKVSSILAVVGLLTSRGFAAAPGDAEFEQGMQLYRSRDCAAAVGPLEAAAAAGPRPGALLALGFCYRQLKQFPKATNAYQRYLQLRADDEKHALSLLEQTMEEERDWRKTHPEAAAETRPPPPAKVEAPPAAIAVAPKPAAVPPAALSPASAPEAKHSGIGWPVWVGAGALVVGAGVLAAVLLSKSSSSSEPSVTFNGR